VGLYLNYINVGLGLVNISSFSTNSAITFTSFYLYYKLNVTFNFFRYNLYKYELNFK